MRRALLVLAAVGVLVACGSDEPAETATISLSNLAFSGAQSVGVGQTIELVNSDEVLHTWTAEDGSFDVSIPAGQTVTYTFDEPGEYSYFCEIHPSMTGTIRVEG